MISMLILIVIIFVTHGTHVASQTSDVDPLKVFLDTLAESQPDLLWIEDAVKSLHGTEDQGQVTKRDLTNLEEPDLMYDEFDSEFEEEEEPRLSFIETGEQWYEKFREKECVSSKKEEYCHKKTRDQKLFDTVQESYHLEKILEPKTFPRLPNPAIPVRDDEDEQEEEEYTKRQNDDLNTINRNTLIEEANSEKLSKHEQELAAVSVPKELKELQDSVDTSQGKRRSVNPANEIKLKISNKMMQKGMGPSLPSFGYNDGKMPVYRRPNKEKIGSSRSDKVDDSFVFPYKEHELPNYNLFKRDEDPSVDDLYQLEGNEGDQDPEWANYDETQVQMDQTDDQTFGSRHLLSLSNDRMHDKKKYHLHKRPDHHKYPKKLEQEFDYEKLAKELHVFGPKIKDAHIEYGSQMSKAHIGVAPDDKRQGTYRNTETSESDKGLGKEETNRETNEQESDMDSSERKCSKVPHLKKPLGRIRPHDHTSQVPNPPNNVIQVSNNGSNPVVNVKVELNPTNLTGMGNVTLAKIQIGTSKSRRFVKNDRHGQKRDEPQSTIAAMRHLIDNVYKSLDDDPDLKNWISPHLMSRYDALYGEAEVETSKNSKDNKSNESQLRGRNLNEVSSKIERLIEKEVQSRICVQLPPEMDAYYRKLTRDSEVSERSDWNVNGRRVRSVDLDQISSKYETVQDLLRQFDSLPRQEQRQLTSIKDMLDNHMRLLDELKEAIVAKEDRPNETNRTSDRFERLSKAVTFIRKANKP